MTEAAFVQTHGAEAKRSFWLAVGAFASLDECRATLAAPLRFEPGLDDAARAHRRRRWAEAIARARTSPG